MELDLRTIVGSIARRLPRGRGRVANWLHRHPGDGPVEYVDGMGHARMADLRDAMECQWFAGVHLGLPSDALGRVGPGDWAIDIGANIGVVTGQLAARVGDSGHVWAIEPVPRNIECLRDLRERNGLKMVRTFGVALGAVDGTVTLRLPPPGHSGWASVTASWIDADEITVPVRSLDSLVAEHGSEGRLALIKIDVEGYESEVLAGATETLRRFGPLLYVEFNDVILQDAGSSSVELLGRFRDAGYRPVDRAGSTAARLRMRVVDLLLEPADARAGS
jgi:FkbM family methyltransferase